MFSNDPTGYRQIVASAIGTVLLSAACVVAAVGPARAQAPTTTVSVVQVPVTGLVGAVRY